MSCRECVYMCLRVCVCVCVCVRLAAEGQFDGCFGTTACQGKDLHPWKHTEHPHPSVMIALSHTHTHTHTCAHTHTHFFSCTHLIGYSIKIRPKLDQQGPPSWLSCLPNTLTRKEQNWQIDNWMTNVRETVWTMITSIILPGLSERVEKNREDEDAAQQTSIHKAFERNFSW